ncbi:MAG: CNNM domain-containing protein, partial [Kiritimatiellia bacterium]
MSSTALIQILLLIIFFIGSWFFSGFESGIISINRHRLVHLVRHGDKSAKVLAAILRDTHRLLATTLVGNNICNVTLSTLAAAIAYTAANRWNIGRDFLQLIATLVIATLMLVIGEFLPKLWFTARPIERSKRLIPPFLVLRAILYPLASLCILLTRLVTPRNREKRSPFVSRENINFLTRDSEAHGQISAFERLMIKQVLDLQLRKASQLMTPMSKIVRIYEGDSLSTVLRVFRQSHHRIVPIFSENDERCLGVLHLFDLLRSRSENPTPSDLRRAPVFVHHDTPVDDLLPYMRARSTKVLIVR